LQSSLDNSSIDEIKIKYGLGNSIASINELEILDGLENFELTISKKLKCSIQLHWNGVALIFWEDNWKRKQQAFFATFYLLKSISRTEYVKFVVQLNNNQQILLAAISSTENTAPEAVKEFETKYNIARDDFFN
jgi:hypothetical protein